MTSTTEPAMKTNRPLFGIRALHIFTLCAFAFTQPLLVALAKQTIYLRDERVGWLEISVLLTILTLILPLGFLLLDQIVFRVSQRFRGRGRNTVFIFLISIVLLSLLRPYLSMKWIDLTGFSGLLSVIMVIPGSWFVASIYERLPLLRSWLSIASVGLVIFPGIFLWKFSLNQKAEVSLVECTMTKAAVPIVLVVFDEFNGTTLMDERMEIDAERFPQFARLGQCSTWYSNATTVHPRTNTAVPAMLSGRFPEPEISATRCPGNLLQVIESTKKFDMAVFEPVTRLCPDSVRKIPPQKRSSMQKCLEVLHTVGAVYPRLILTRDVPIDLPEIPRPWFGLPIPSRWGIEYQSMLTEGLFNYSWTEERKQQSAHFLKCLRWSERPRFCFYHMVLPHFPWCYLPTGEQYQIEVFPPAHAAGTSGELGEDWLNDPATVLRNEYRYRLQVGYADRLIGQIMDRLEAIEMLDRCLLIVTGDHGVSFRAGHSRRLPDAENLADLMSVPLFIKLPGQSQGQIDDRNIELVDLLPTIAEVLGIELPEPVDGIPVTIEKRRARKTLYFDSGMTIVEPDFPQRSAAVKRQFASFGSGELEQPLIGAAIHPDWHGRPVTSFPRDDRTIQAEFGEPLGFARSSANRANENFVNCFVTGRLKSRDLPTVPADLVVVADGIIIDSGKTFPVQRDEQGFEFLLPKSVAKRNAGKVELYLVDQSEQRLRFTRLTNPSEKTALSSGH